MAMDYFQGIVVEYLRADRSVFVNTECLIQLNPIGLPDKPHWYCDALAVDFRRSTVFLCEVSYAAAVGALVKRLGAWNAHWSKVCIALKRDCSLSTGVNWSFRPWLFVHDEGIPFLVKGISRIGTGKGESREMPDPLISTLEMVVPWKYKSWNRVGEDERKKPPSIPESMRTA
jgi:hypothetical protein